MFKADDIVRSYKQPDAVIPYLVIEVIGSEARCINLIDKYKYTIPIAHLYLWVTKTS